MKNIPPPSPIVEHRDPGPADSTQAEIERRAAEIADIEGREVTAADRVRAQRELNGKDLPAAIEDDADSAESLSRDPSDPPVQRGRQTPNLEDTSEQNDLQKMVSEGVEEAQHDQMLASRQKKSV